MYRDILLIDNFDSFTYNLVDFFRLLGCRVKVYRNTIDPEDLVAETFDLLVLSPGPSIPERAGNLMQIIARFYRQKPILGVCLGHQALVEFFGGSLENIPPVHGKAVSIDHDGRSIFTGLEPTIKVARYHSWAAKSIPPELEVSARATDGTVLAVRHKRLPIEGIQFHPESVLSMQNDAGMRLLRNVVAGRLAAGNQVYHRLSHQLQTGIPIEPKLLQKFLHAVEEDQLSEDQKQILLVALSLRLRDAGALKQFIELLLFPGINAWAENWAGMNTWAEKRVGKQALAAIPNRAIPNPNIPVPDNFSPGIHAWATDICGTGGSGLPRINTSTLASLLLAHCGLPIAKHGNRAAAGRFGSFDLLEALGVPIRTVAADTQKTLQQTNLAFLFAPDIYPVFRHFAPVRARIGVPTVFNVLGPLINPLQPKRQFIGTAFADLMEVIFETGIKLGREHLLVARGWDGLDEISLSAATRILEFHKGKRQEYEISPQDFGLETLPFEALSAANPAESLAIAKAILAGVPTTEHYKLVAANAAFIYTRFVEEIPLREAYSKMERHIFEGALGTVLEKYTAALEAPALVAAEPV
jgi:anthranilate synthase/phosphoribosyltransferase